MEYVILVSIGLVMGIFGGLLGIGGSVVMIPAMVIAFKGNQHLYQASAMICNFIVAASAVMVHRKEGLLVKDVIKWLVPAAIIGILLGVAVSNFAVFQGTNSTNLTRLFGLYLIYVAFYNIFRLIRSSRSSGDGLDISNIKPSSKWSLITGVLTGFIAGLLGMGGGTVSTPMQQFTMKMPLKRAMINSSALIASMSLIGALYKNITLPEHGQSIAESLKIAVIVMPTAIIGGAFGGRLMHLLPKNIVRIIFIALVVIGAYRLVTI